ncbi:MAG: VOC family protein [Pseudomonadota bacterium]
MAKLETLTLRARDPEAQRRFYCDVLGMHDQGDGRVGYSASEVALRFVQAQAPHDPRPTDLYWKIAVSVPNIDLAVAQLEACGVTPSPPRQFRDVGYLAKVTDPEGFVIELIDHWFQGERPDQPHDETRLGGGAHLSLITLRTADIGAIEPDLLSRGMSPLSVQPVEPYGFTLYFYAFTDEAPPDPDLTAIANRPWVYQRPYSVLEIQHVHALAAETSPAEGAGGYSSLSVRSPGEPVSLPRLRIVPEREG